MAEPKKLLIIGGGKGAELIAAHFYKLREQEKQQCGFACSPVPHGILDDVGDKARGGLPWLGIVLPWNWSPNDYTLAISISTDMTARKQIFCQFLKVGFEILNVNRSEFNGTELGIGNLIFPDVHTDLYCTIGDNNVISAGCIIAHHNHIGSHNLLGPGCMFSGSVTIGNDCIIGSGVIIERTVRIGDRVKIASGTVITGDVPSDCHVQAKVSTSCMQIHQGDRQISRRPT